MLAPNSKRAGMTEYRDLVDDNRINTKSLPFVVGLPFFSARCIGWRVASFTFLSAIGLGCSFWQLLLLVGEQYAFAFAPFFVFDA